jgi:Protein tyrosine and serine/threonine kinase
MPIPPGTQFPIRWADPLIWQTHEFSKANDVYSFGVCLWEICARTVPWPEITTNAQVQELIDEGTVMPIPPLNSETDIPDKVLAALYGVMQDCWELQSDARPDFAELRVRLARHRSKFVPDSSDESSSDSDINSSAQDEGDFDAFYATRYTTAISGAETTAESEYSSVIPMAQSTATPLLAATDSEYSTVIAAPPAQSPTAIATETGVYGHAPSSSSSSEGESGSAASSSNSSSSSSESFVSNEMSSGRSSTASGAASENASAASDQSHSESDGESS